MAESRTEQAYAVLKSRVMDGTYAPGYRLVVDQLRRESDISAIPWREALRRLEAEGWVEIIPHTGARVKAHDANAWTKTVRLLARLEGLATSLAVGRMSESAIADARRLNDQLAEALANFDPRRFGQLSTQFHHDICSHTDDPRLFELLESEWARLELVRSKSFWYAPGRALKSIAEHNTMLDLIEGGADPELIENAARQHKLNTLGAVEAHERAEARA